MIHKILFIYSVLNPKGKNVDYITIYYNKGKKKVSKSLGKLDIRILR